MNMLETVIHWKPELFEISFLLTNSYKYEKKKNFISLRNDW